jgi:hypothetical protein
LHDLLDLMPIRPNLRLLLCLLALSAATLLAACGGGDDDVDAILAETFGGESQAVDSGRLDLAFTLDAQGLPQLEGPVSIRLAGPFASQEEGLPRFDFDVALSASGQDVRAGAVSTGEQGFLKFQDQAYDVGEQLYAQFASTYEQSQAAQPDRPEGGANFAALGVDPRRWLTDASNEGTEEVGGAETIRISGGIDVSTLLEDLNRLLGQAGELGVTGAGEVPNELSEEQRAQIAEAVQDANVDIYTGADDKILRRLRLDVTFEVPEDAREGAGGLQGGELELDLTIAGLNEEQEIAAPDGARPLAELTGALGLGGAQGQGGAAPPADGAAPPAGGAQPPAGGLGGAGAPGMSGAYLQCVEDAGEDVAELQGCARLLATP